jgi:hypothetical protein
LEEFKEFFRLKMDAKEREPGFPYCNQTQEINEHTLFSNHGNAKFLKLILMNFMHCTGIVLYFIDV